MRGTSFLIVFAALLAAPAASAQVGNAPFCLATDSAYGGSRTAGVGALIERWPRAILAVSGAADVPSARIRQGDLSPRVNWAALPLGRNSWLFAGFRAGGRRVTWNTWIK
jgi:hypothetical protein